jgi:hypothetical protein
MGRLIAQGEEDGRADRPSPHAASATPPTATAAPAHAGTTHGVGKEVFVRVFVAWSAVVRVLVAWSVVVQVFVAWSVVVKVFVVGHLSSSWSTGSR